MRYKLLFIALLLILSACAHPYIGLPVRTTGPFWCHTYAFSKSCVIITEHLKYDFEINYNAVTSECSINGHIEPVSIKSFSNFEVDKSTFYFIFANNGVVVDVVSFLISSDNLQNNIPLNLTFKTKPFDSVSIDYSFVVSG
ncbi:MAG: hypothetical protein KKD92_00695 [Proteobacteria bacterium]|nr:hypothetical protein [Pseudomonadota bacterium]